MKTNIFITGTENIPTHLMANNTFACHLIDNPYNLPVAIKETTGTKIVIIYLPFIESRHFDLYTHLQRTIKNMTVFFIVNELSHSMKNRLRANNDFVVLWKTEESHLENDILARLRGKQISLREDKRENLEINALLSPSSLPLNFENQHFQPILGGCFENISANGFCVKIKAPFYTKKDFINMTYQNQQGDYVSIEGQIRWSKWNKVEQTQELGVQLLAQS